jgi:hypothetical protein
MSRIVGTGLPEPWQYSEHLLERPVLTPAVRRAMPHALLANFGPAYSDRLWPRSRLQGSDPAAPTDATMVERVEFWRDDRPLGAGGWGRITGVTKDSAGAVLGGCSVHLFRTADDVEVDQVVSDAGDGTYSVGTPTDDTHYAVAYKAGSPDVAGTTVDTLTGS